MQGFDFKPAKTVAGALELHWAFLRDRRLQGQFIEGVHYRRVPGIRGYCYCESLVRDWINCGGDFALHQAAIDKFLATQSVIRRRRA